jgi:hypothetical protein
MRKHSFLLVVMSLIALTATGFGQTSVGRSRQPTVKVYRNETVQSSGPVVRIQGAVKMPANTNGSLKMPPVQMRNYVNDTHSTLQAPAMKTPNSGDAGNVKACASGGIGGVNGKVCVGTDGISSSVTGGVGVSAGVSTTTSWDGKVTQCGTVSGSVGTGYMGTGSVSSCVGPDGKNFTKVGGGVGVGAGTEGYKLGATVEYSRRIGN